MQRLHGSVYEHVFIATSLCDPDEDMTKFVREQAKPVMCRMLNELGLPWSKKNLDRFVVTPDGGNDVALRFRLEFTP